MTRFYTAGFHRGILDRPWFSRHNSEEQVLGVRAADNCTLLPDGSLERRWGSVKFAAAPAASTGLQGGRVIPYSAANTDFLIYLRGDDISVDYRTIHVYQKTGGAWSSTPVAWRSTDATVGVSDFTPYLDNTNVASTTVEAHPWTEAELADVRWCQFDDKLFLMHPDHPTMMIQYQAGGTWTWQPYALEESPPEIGSVRRGLTWTITPPASGDLHTISTNQPLFDGSMLPSQKDQPSAAEAPQITFAVGPTTYGIGSIFRFGSLPLSVTSTGTTVRQEGALWTVVGVTSPTEATIVPLCQVAAGALTSAYTLGSGYSTENTSEWAGGWHRTGETVASFTLSAAIDTTDSTPITATGGNILDEHYGCMLVSATLGTVFYVQEVDEGAATARLYNYGKGATAVATGTMYVYKPSESFLFVGSKATMTTDAYIIGKDQAPDGHDEAFTDIGWIGKGPVSGTDVAEVGGSIMAGGGLIRIESAGTTDVQNLDGRKVTSHTVWFQKAPANTGPFCEYGWGPSKAAGFAACGTSHQRRLWLGGYAANSAAIVGSQTNTPTKQNALEFAGYADGPLNLLLGFEEGDEPKWLASGDFLMIGCERNEYILDGNPISTGSLGFEKVGSHGSSSVDPVTIGPMVLWVGNDGTEVWEAVFEDRHNSVVARPLLWKAKDTLGATITQMTAIQDGLNQVFCLTSGGKILSYTHNEDSGSSGWTEWWPAQPSAGATTPAFDRYADIAKVRNAANTGWELCTLNRRTYSGPQYIYEIEFMSDAHVGDMYAAATSLTQTTCSVAGPTDRDWHILVDGVYGGVYTSSGTTIDYTALNLSGAPSSVICYAVAPVIIDVLPPPVANQRGPSAGQKLSVRSVSVFVDDSYGGTVRSRAISTAVIGTAPTVGNGWITVPGGLSGVRETLPVIEIRQQIPYGFRVCALAYDGGLET